jgi:coiled-coil domain-containing protein 130
MAQGFNMGRYIPPDLVGVQSFNQASGKGHALGARASKLASSGILIVRFECPFAIWCTNCQPEQIIGQGVRFNAEKKKVGNYYSTPIWSFRIKHTTCGEWIEVRTDPKNAEYVVVEGGRKRDTGEGKLLDGEVRIGLTEEEKDRLEKEGAFGALERKVEDKKVHDEQTKRIEGLLRDREKSWADPYEKSRLLRKDFRIGRRKRQADEKTGEALQEKFGLGVDMLAPEDDDAERAKLIGFGEVKGNDVATKPMFVTKVVKPTEVQEKSRGKGGNKAEGALLVQKSTLQDTLRGNTRIAIDPFLREDKPWQPQVKRMRVDAEGEISGVNEMPAKPEATALVDYDSDSS